MTQFFCFFILKWIKYLSKKSSLIYSIKVKILVKRLSNCEGMWVYHFGLFTSSNSALAICPSLYPRFLWIVIKTQKKRFMRLIFCLFLAIFGRELTGQEYKDAELFLNGDKNTQAGYDRRVRPNQGEVLGQDFSKGFFSRGNWIIFDLGVNHQRWNFGIKT